MEKLEQYIEMEEKGEVENLPPDSRYTICSSSKTKKRWTLHMPGYPKWVLQVELAAWSSVRSGFT